MLNKALAAGAAVALLALAACAPEVDLTVPLSSVMQVVTDGGSASAPALLRIPQGSEEECKDGLAGLIEKLKALAPVTGDARCTQSAGGDQLAELGTAIAIVREGDAVPEPNLFALEIAENGSGSSLTFRLLKPIPEVTEALSGDSGIDVEFDPSLYTVTLQNDLGSTLEVYPDHALVNGEPHLPGMDGVVLANGDKVAIRLSNVAAVHVDKAQAYTFAGIGIPY
jgi:hypothetical protein